MDGMVVIVRSSTVNTQIERWIFQLISVMGIVKDKIIILKIVDGMGVTVMTSIWNIQNVMWILQWKM